MDNQIHVPSGRSSAMFTFVLASAISIVLVIVSFLTGHSQYEEVLDIWAIFLIVMSLAAMLAFALMRRNSNHVTLCEEQQHNSSGYWIFLTATIFSGIGASIFPWFETVRLAPCFGTENKFDFFAAKFLRVMFLGLLTLAELAFLIICRKYQCKSSCSRMLISIVMSANFYIFLNSVLDVFRAANSDKDTVLNPDEEIFTVGNQTTSDQYYVFFHCNITSVDVDKHAGQTNRYLYQFPFEYCLLALNVLGPMWNVIVQTPNITLRKEEGANGEENSSNHIHISQTTSSQAIYESTPCLLKFLKKFKLSLQFLSEHSCAFSTAYVLLVFAFNVVVEIEVNSLTSQNSNDDNITETENKLETANYYVQTVYIYIIGIVTFIGYLVSRKNNPSNWQYDCKSVLLCIGATGHLLLVLFEMFDSFSVLINKPEPHLAEKLLFFVETLFDLLGIYCQTMLIWKAGCMTTNQLTNLLQLQYVKGVIIFLGLCNIELFLGDSFLTTPTLKYIDDIQDDIFGYKNWWLLTRLMFPTVIFYRLFSALLCFELVYKMRGRHYQFL